MAVRPKTVLCAVLVALASSLANAEENWRAFMLSASCAACHGTDGRSPDSIPTIHGKSAEYIARKLNAYRSGEGNPTVMNRLAKGYSEEEIEQIAAWFGAQSR